MKKITLASCLLCMQLSVMAQKTPPTPVAVAVATDAIAEKIESKATEFAQTITKEDLKKHLSILASDEYEGRETGEKGQKMAAEYIIKYFKTLGLSAPVKSNEKNPHLQTFKLAKKSWGESYIQTSDNKYKLFEDFFAYGHYKHDAKAEFVFVGYGIETEGYSDFENVDVKGKIVIFVADEPKDKDGNYVFSKSKTMSAFAKSPEKAKLAKAKGAAGVMQVFETQAAYNMTLMRYKTYFAAPSIGFPETEKAAFATLFTYPKVAADILDIKEAKFTKLLAQITENRKPLKKKFSEKVMLKMQSNNSEVETENVLGFMEGTDKKDEIVIITAHYDHIGITDGKINNGADDDGSGTVSVLEIAEAFTKAKEKGFAPRRSILFMLFTGEEKGLLGSEYYAANPIFPLKQTIVDLNIDMVGRVDEKHEKNPNYIYVIGADKLSTELHNINENAQKQFAPDIELDYTYNDENDPNRFYYRSDHYNFAVNNIPIIFYFNGVHADYHQPTDDVEKINFEKMEKIDRMIFHTAWELANRNEKPKVDKQGK